MELINFPVLDGYELNSEYERKKFLDFIKNNNINFDKIKNFFDWTNKSPKYYEDFNYILELYSKKYSLNLDHLISLCKSMTLEVLKYLYNDNLKVIINLDDNNFYKLLSFFNDENTKLNEYSLNNILEALTQKAFKVENKKLFMVFKETLKKIYDNDLLLAKNIVSSVFYHNMEELEKNGYTIKSLLDALKSNNVAALNFYHQACNKYIDFKRNEFVNKRVRSYKDFNLVNTYEVNSAIKTIINKIDFDILNLYIKNLSLTDEEKTLVNNKELFKKIFDFKKNHSNKIEFRIKDNINTFNRIMDKFYSNYKDDHEIHKMLMKSNVKRLHVLPEVDYNFLICVICNLSKEEIIRNLNDENTFNGLKKIFSKYKFLSVNNLFEELSVASDVSISPDVIASIFVNYKKIMNEVEKTGKINMTSILEVADVYSSTSKMYEIVFGEEDNRYIFLNPGVQKAPETKKERMRDIYKYIPYVFEREEVPIPSFDEIINIPNNKQINLVVGNVSNIINLTLGERTDSCVRSGGLANDFYEFCIKNKNGFNIRFHDPETNELISKVNGFRNGNTVFLNQLAFSISDKYNSYDLIYSIKYLAKKIINDSKKSQYPVDNVVITLDKAMSYSNIPLTNLKIDLPFKGLVDHLSIDLLSSGAAVLASSNENNKLIPIVLGSDKITYYEPQRDKVLVSKNATNTVRHMEAIEQVLASKTLEELIIPEGEYETCIYGEDWYIAVSKDGNIVNKIMNYSHDKEKAKEEMNKILVGVEYIENIFKNKSQKI